MYEVVGAALRCVDKCQQYLGIDTDLGVYDQFRCTTSCLLIKSAQFTESGPKAVVSPTPGDAGCKSGCWLTNSTYWGSTKRCVELDECPAFYADGADHVCVQECARVQLESRECRTRCPEGQYADVDRVCKRTCSTNAYRQTGGEARCVELSECAYFVTDPNGQFFCQEDGCPAGFRVFDESTVPSLCVERCPRFEAGVRPGEAACVTECGSDQFWVRVGAGGLEVARCVESCADLGAVDVATRECVRPGTCRFIVPGDNGVI